MRKTTSAYSLDYIYDSLGREVVEISSCGCWSRGEVYAGGRHLATYANGTTYFVNADWLGTERVRTAVNGSIFETCQSLPYGDGLSCSGGDVSPLHFTGKMHDGESNLDDFGARYYTSTMGRWMTPDWSARGEAVPYATLTNPQSLNLYAYVLDNPETSLDADGHKTALGDSAESTNGCSENKTTCQQSSAQVVAANQTNDPGAHPVHEDALLNQTTSTDASGGSAHAQIVYANAQNTSGKGQASFKAGAGVQNTTLKGPGGRINIQTLTANAEGHVGLKGFGVGASARVVSYGAGVSFKVGGYTVALKDSVSAIGIGAHFRVDWSHGFSVGAGAIAGVLGESLGISVERNQ